MYSSESEDDDLVYADDNLKKKRVSLGDFLPKAKVPDEPIDWASCIVAPKEVKTMVPLPNNKQDKMFVDSLRTATINGNMDFLKKYIDEGGLAVDITLKSGWTSLMYACNHAHVELVKFLLDHGADPNYHKKFFTPLMAAVCASSENLPKGTDIQDAIIKCIELLVAKGAKVSAQDAFQISSLHFAVKKNHPKVVDKLIECGSKIDQQDRYGFTPLHYAVKFKFSEIVKILLEKGANTSLKNDDEQTPEQMAEDDDKEILNLFTMKNAGIEINGTTFSDNQEPKKEMDQETRETTALKSDLMMFLYGIGLPDLESIFTKNHFFHLSDILLLTDEDLIKMGITSFGHRKKLLDQFKEFHLSPFEKESLPRIEPYKQEVATYRLTTTKLHHLMFNISRQLSFMRSHVRFAARELKNHPNMFEGDEEASVELVVQAVKDCYKGLSDVDHATNIMIHYLKKTSQTRTDLYPVGYIPPQSYPEIDDSEFMPINLSKKESCSSSFLVPLAFGIGAVCGYLLAGNKFFIGKLPSWL